jgi:hypothetical protein
MLLPASATETEPVVTKADGCQTWNPDAAEKPRGDAGQDIRRRHHLQRV